MLLCIFLMASPELYETETSSHYGYDVCPRNNNRLPRGSRRFFIVYRVWSIGNSHLESFLVTMRASMWISILMWVSLLIKSRRVRYVSTLYQAIMNCTIQMHFFASDLHSENRIEQADILTDFTSCRLSSGCSYHISQKLPGMY